MSYAGDADRVLAALRGLDAPATARTISRYAFDYKRRCALGFDSLARTEEILRDLKSRDLAVRYGLADPRWGPPTRSRS
jgi:hypothetical protein